MAQTTARSAAERGTATHLVLQHLDFARPLDAADVDAQIERLVARRLVTPEQGAAVDRAAVEWFVGTDIGRLMRDHVTGVMRELPVYFAAPADVAGATPSADPQDRVMVRGRLDAMVVTPAGLTIVDFKTDAVEGDRMHDRIALYRPQLEQYRRAIEQITGLPVVRVCLAFLAPRVVWDL